MEKSKLTGHQVIYRKRNIAIEDWLETIKVEIRYDDQCGNGHNTFSITGEIISPEGDPRCGLVLISGCIHDEISKHFPELRHLLKWHGMSSDGPLHYIANTLYHARDKDHTKYAVGAAVKWNTKLKFDGIPFTFPEQTSGFWEFVDGISNFEGIETCQIDYDGNDTHQYTPNYSLTGFLKPDATKQWYNAPFKSKSEASEFLEALQNHSYKYIKTPTAWCKAITPDLRAARNSAIWKDATLMQLQNEKLLMERLPELIEEFRADIESIGLKF